MISLKFVQYDEKINNILIFFTISAKWQGDILLSDLATHFAGQEYIYHLIYTQAF